MRLQFTMNINVGQTAYSNGQEIDAKEIPEGAVESLIRTKSVRVIADEEPPPPPRPSADKKPA